jgi:lipopolysaccharide export system permease protein
MSRLSKTILNNFSTYFIISVVLFTSILTGTAIMFEAITMAFEFGLNALDLIILIVYQAPRLITYSFGLSALIVGSIITSSMSQNRELVALRAAGVGYGRVFRLLVVCGTIITLGFIGINETLVPYCERQVGDFQYYLQETKQPNIQPGTSYIEYDGKQPKRLIYVHDANENQLNDITLIDYTQTGGVQSISQAKSGAWLPGLGWRFYNGLLYALSGQSLIEIGYERQHINLIDFRKQSSRSVRELNSYDLYQALIQKNKAGKKTPQEWVEFHLKFALPVSCLIFTLLGAALGIQPMRQRQSNPLGACALIIIGYYVILSIATSIAMNGALSPALAAWLPNGVMGGVTVYVLRNRLTHR